MIDRFEDALRVRAEQVSVKGCANDYVAGYLLSMVRELYHTSGDAAKRIEKSVEWIEDSIRNDGVQKFPEQELVDLMWQNAKIAG
jgi:hypothetical protein